MFFPICIILLEILLRILDGSSLLSSEFIRAVLPVLFVSSVIGLLISLINNRKTAKVLICVLIEITTLWFILSYFTFDAYKVFMTPAAIIQEAGNVASEFSDRVRVVITNGFYIILVFHLPLILYLIFSKKVIFKKRKIAVAASALLLVLSIIFSSDIYNKSSLSIYDNNVRNYGLLCATAKAYIKPDSTEPQFTAHNSDTQPSTSVPVPAETEKPVEYGYNEMDIDFASLAESTSNTYVRQIHEYVNSLSPSRKNEYTGLFEGKNLILITAESFTKEVIDEVRTPTLYRLANSGIVFEDFYQPAWGGSTSTGEYSFLVGLVPFEPTVIQYSQTNNFYFTMGNQLQRQNYYSIAYHDGLYYYYGRDYTHTHLGYSTFLGNGNGLEGKDHGGNSQGSDLGMMIATVSDYIDNQPFSVYYMTISGHANYAFNNTTNSMSVKHMSETENLPYSESVRAYLACNMELEYALEYLVDELENAGIADDTVIALVSDHYPYGLCRSVAWETDSDQLSVLYGYDSNSSVARDHNAAIIWSGCLEKIDPIVISGPTYSLDILPTLSNLFGLEYDSRLLVGRDVLSDTPALVLWNDGSWLTEYGYYDGRTFSAKDGYDIPDDYVAQICSEVNDKRMFSESVVNCDYYKILFGKDEIR